VKTVLLVTEPLMYFWGKQKKRLRRSCGEKGEEERWCEQKGGKGTHGWPSGPK